METQTVHLHKNEDYSGSKLFYIILPILAFFIIFTLFFLVAGSSRRKTASTFSPESTNVLGTQSNLKK